MSFWRLTGRDHAAMDMLFSHAAYETLKALRALHGEPSRESDEPIARALIQRLMWYRGYRKFDG